jgi:Family of unknown function (DUF6459)
MRGQSQAPPARPAAAGRAGTASRPRSTAAAPRGPGDAQRRPGDAQRGPGDAQRGPGGDRRRDIARPLPDPVALRLCRVPETAPPYDDEDSGETGAARADAFAAAITAALDARGRPGQQADASGQPGGAGRAGTARPAGGPAGPGSWPSKFAQVLAETLAGARPPAQLTPWTTERARSHIRRLGPMLAAGQRPLVQRVVTSLPAADVIEMSVVVGFGSRVRALAVRLERTEPHPPAPGHADTRAHWVCTAVEAA